MPFAASEWTNQALPPFHAGSGTVLLLASAGILTALTLATYLLRSTLTFRRTLGLLGLRLGALLLVFLLIWRPTLASYDEDSLAPSELYILLDASESMATPDEGPGLTRFQRGKDMIESGSVTDMLKRLSREKRIETKFFQGAFDVKPLDASAAPLGKRTEMGHWLSDLLEKRGSNPLRGVILLSDGIDNGRKLTLVEAGRYRGVAPLHTLGLGKPTTTTSRKDVAVRDIKVEPSEGVPVKAKMTVTGTIDAPGYVNSPVNVVLSMEDKKTGKMKPVATLKNVPLRKEKGNEVTLVADAPDLPGEVKVELSVEELGGEVNKDNNRIVSYVPIEKGGVTILWVEGAPRHEAVFAMRNGLAADKRFRVFYALKPVGAKADPADDFAFDKRHYDVIVIGDISAKRFSGDNPVVFRKLKDMVQRGTGLLMLGGFESFGESDWQSSPIASILPVELEKGQHEGKVRIVPTGVGLNYLLRLTDDPDANKKLWDVDLPPLEGANRVGKLKSGVTPMAWGITADKEKLAILASTNYGDGRVLTFAGDTTHQAWIRPKTPEGPSTVKEYGRFWKQMMLWLAHQEDAESNLRVKLEMRRVDAGAVDKLPFTVEFRTATGMPFEKPELSAKLMTKTRGEQEVTLTRDKDGNYRGEIGGIIEPGEYALQVTGKGTDGKDVVAKTTTARFMAYAEDIETTRVAANPDFLEKVASAGGGKYFPADESKLLQLLEELAVERASAARPRVDYWPTWQRQPASDSVADQWDALWSTPMLLISILFVMLISTEWVLRRKWGMV